MGLDVHGVEDRNPFDLQQVIMTGGKEQMLGKSDPEASPVLQQVLAYPGNVQEAFAVSDELGGQQQVMQYSQWSEVMFVQNLVDRIKFVGDVSARNRVRRRRLRLKANK